MCYYAIDLYIQFYTIYSVSIFRHTIDSIQLYYVFRLECLKCILVICLIDTHRHRHTHYIYNFIYIYNYIYICIYIIYIYIYAYILLLRKPVVILKTVGMV